VHIQFGAFLLIIFLTQLVIGITAAVAKDDFANAMKLSLRKSLGNYSYTDVDRQAWDSTQRYLQCCGVDSPRDWSQIFSENQVPPSCCRDPPDSPLALCRNTFDDRVVFQQGCFERMAKQVREKSTIIMGVGIGIALVEVIGIVLSCCLASTIKNEQET
ncbi:hypothetical protein WDU94_003146, partial [Cyamophila willieti]